MENYINQLLTFKITKSAMKNKQFHLKLRFQLLGVKSMHYLRGMLIKVHTVTKLPFFHFQWSHWRTVVTVVFPLQMIHSTRSKHTSPCSHDQLLIPLIQMGELYQKPAHPQPHPSQTWNKDRNRGPFGKGMHLEHSKDGVVHKAR